MKAQKIKLQQISNSYCYKTWSQIVTQLKNSNCDKTLKKSNCDQTKNSNCDKTQKHKVWQNSETQIVTKLKNSNYNHTQTVVTQTVVKL